MPPKNEIPNITRHVSMPDETWIFIDRQANALNLTRSAYIKKIFDEEQKREKRKTAKKQL